MQIFQRESTLARFLHRLHQLFFHLTQLGLPHKFTVLRSHKTALTRNILQKSVPLQFLVSPLGSDDGDPQLLSQEPHGGQRLALGELA